MKKVIVLKSGEKFPVIREDSKYMYCEGTQFKKNHPDIAEILSGKKADEELFGNLPDVESIEKELDAEQKVLEESVVPKKKTTTKKKAEEKKGE